LLCRLSFHGTHIRDGFLDVLRLLLLLEVEDLGIDVFDRSLDVGHRGCGDSNATSGEYFEGGLRIFYLVGHAWVKLWLIGSLSECLRERCDFDGEGQRAGAQHVDDSPVLDPDVLVLVVQLLKDSGELSGGDSCLVLAVGPRARDFPRAPY